jgi:hypothetical protein
MLCIPALYISPSSKDAEQRHRAQRKSLEQSPHFFHAEGNGETLQPFGSDGVDFKLGLQDFAEQKKKGGEGLFLVAGSDLAIDGEVSEEGVDFAISHFRGAAPESGFIAMEAEKAFHPVEVGCFGGNGKILGPVQLASFFEQWRPAMGEANDSGIRQYPDCGSNRPNRALNILPSQCRKVEKQEKLWLSPPNYVESKHASRAGDTPT